MDDGKKRKSDIGTGEGVAKKFKVLCHNSDIKMPVTLEAGSSSSIEIGCIELVTDG